MAKRIKKINVTSDKKGTVKNPYTIEEHEQMLAEGQWTEDGFVEELGLVEGEMETNPDQMGDDYYGYEEDDDDLYDENGNFIWKKVDDGECLIGSILNAGRLLGYNMHYNKIKKDLSIYYISSINRYNIPDNKLEELFCNYYYAESTKSISKVNDYLNANCPVNVRKKVRTTRIPENNMIVEELHDVLLISHDSKKKTYTYYDATNKKGDGFETITESQLKDAMLFKQSFYVLDKVH